MVAPVVPLIAMGPVVVGVPDSVQVMDAPGATLVGGVGEHVSVNPVGTLVAHVAAVAAIVADTFLHVNMPL